MRQLKGCSFSFSQSMLAYARVIAVPSLRPFQRHLNATVADRKKILPSFALRYADDQPSRSAATKKDFARRLGKIKC